MSTYINPSKPKALQYEDCPPLLRLFVEHERAILNHSARTANAYYIEVRGFLRFLKRERGLVPEDTPIDEIKISDVSRETIESVERRDIVRYLYYLADERHNSPETRSHKLISIRRFFRYMCHEQGLRIDPTMEIRGPKTSNFCAQKPIYMNVEESSELLDAAGSRGRYVERNYCMITFLLNLGLRVSELVAIDTDDITEGAIAIHGKGNKARTVYINAACSKALMEYMEVREKWVSDGLVDKEEIALFVSLMNHGKRITTRAVEKMLRKIVIEAGLDPKYTPHKLRHTAATLLYQYGKADLLTLQRFLGHESPDTTEIYVHLDDQRLINAAQNAPLSSKQRKK